MSCRYCSLGFVGFVNLSCWLVLLIYLVELAGYCCVAVACSACQPVAMCVSWLRVRVSAGLNVFACQIVVVFVCRGDHAS